MTTTKMATESHVTFVVRCATRTLDLDVVFPGGEIACAWNDDTGAKIPVGDITAEERALVAERATRAAIECEPCR